jgi:DNA-binding transcriptional LysR family regulator
VPNVVVYLMWPHALARDPAHRWMRQRLEARLTAL